MENEAPAPSAEGTAAPQPLTLDSALGLLNAQDDKKPEQPARAAQEQPLAPEPAAAEPPEADAAPAEAVEAEAPEPDAEPDAEVILHGNQKTRLRDGSVVAVADLKKAYDEAKEYRAKQSEFDSQRKE